MGNPTREAPRPNPLQVSKSASAALREACRVVLSAGQPEQPPWTGLGTTIVTTICQSLSVVVRRQQWRRIEYGTHSSQGPESEAAAVCKTSTAGSSPALASSFLNLVSCRARASF